MPRRLSILILLAAVSCGSPRTQVAGVGKEAPAGEPATGSERRPSTEELVSWLRELKPLPKVHYSWPVNVNGLSPELLYEYVRLTHALSLRGEGHYFKGREITEEVVDRAVQVCVAVNSTRPRIPPSLAVNYSIWHRKFGKTLLPTDTGPSHAAELSEFRARLESLQRALAKANREHSVTVGVSAVLFDCERFSVRRGDGEWNEAITAKYNAAYDLARSIFPGARVEWYGRGNVHADASADGWSVSTYFTFAEKGDSFACSLYRVPEIDSMRETFRRTLLLARQNGVFEVTPWVALATGYRRQPDMFHKWSSDWDYDLVYSWQLGAELNHPWFGQPEREKGFAPWGAARVVVFHPGPFAPPHWAEHFVAYVRGANLIRRLTDIRSE